MPGLVPAIHADAASASALFIDVDAHGTSPWAEGPRDEPRHDDERFGTVLALIPRITLERSPKSGGC
jgi:hypothetical protein